VESEILKVDDLKIKWIKSQFNPQINERIRDDDDDDEESIDIKEEDSQCEE
jgi:hypothetical protein